MSLEALLEAADRRRTWLAVYDDEPSDLAARFDTRNVTVEHRPLPPTADEGFVVIRDERGFRGAVSIATLEEFLSPPIRRPWDLELLPPAYRAIYDLLDDTLFGSLDRRQLLATARELENLAYRTGRGTLRVGFQSLSAFRAQEEVYRRLADDTDLDIHVYVSPEAPAEDASRWPVTVHTEPADVVGRYWFLVFDGGGDDERTFALVAEQRGPDSFYGFWTYDPEIVARAFEALN